MNLYNSVFSQKIVDIEQQNVRPHNRINRNNSGRIIFRKLNFSVVCCFTDIKSMTFDNRILIIFCSKYIAFVRPHNRIIRNNSGRIIFRKWIFLWFVVLMTWNQWHSIIVICFLTQPFMKLLFCNLFFSYFLYRFIPIIPLFYPNTDFLFIAFGKLLTPRNENFASHPKAYSKAILWALITVKLGKISIYLFVIDWDQG